MIDKTVPQQQFNPSIYHALREMFIPADRSLRIAYSGLTLIEWLSRQD